VAKSKAKTADRARYSVGIDLGTTNCAIARASLDAEAGAGPLDVLPVAQLVEPGEVADRTLLPSFAYIVGEFDFPAGSLRLPWDDDNRPRRSSGMARKRGAETPMRLVASASRGCVSRAPTAQRHSAVGRA